MWKRLIVFSLLAQRNVHSSEIIKNENVRTCRQSKFADCCPCPDVERNALQDQDVANSHIVAASTGDDSCPCMSTSDSEAASSIFSPAFRAVEPFFSRMSRKEQPRPLLNPEVGLASSVLETLREVTDQEYQDALARDAVRNALKFMEPELSETDPGNIVNVILKPKKKSSDDITSEASQIHETSFINPPLTMTNNLKQLGLQPPAKLFKQTFTSPKLTSNGIFHRNRSDMEGSTSNVRESILHPLKNNILEDMKAKSNFLKLKLFPKAENVLKNSHVNGFTGIDKVHRSDDDILKKSYNEHISRVCDNNLPKILDYLKKPLPSNVWNNAPSVWEVRDEEKDFSFSPNIFDGNVRKFKDSDGDNIPQNTDCIDYVREPKELVPLLFKENIEELDVIPSSSKVFEVTNLENGINNKNLIEQNRESERSSDNVFSADVKIELLEPKHVEIINKSTAETENTKNQLENFGDMKFEPSINNNKITNLEDDIDKDCTSIEGENNLDNTRSIDLEGYKHQEHTTSTSSENDVVNLKIQTFPNIKNDIFRTLENFKKANEKIQEKLRSNVQDALQLAVTKPVSHNELRTSVLEPSHTLINNTTKIDKSMSTPDLQKMSDSLLDQSSIKEKSENWTLDSKKDIVEGTEYNNAEINRVLHNDDTVTPKIFSTYENMSKHSINGKPNSNCYKTDENAEYAKEIIPKSSDSSITNNEDNEMIAQSSNSIFNRMPQQDLKLAKMGLLHEDSIGQPVPIIRSIDDIKGFLNGFIPIASETVNNDESFYDYPYENRDTNRGTDFHFDSNLRPYKAKIASPEFLKMNSLFTPSSIESDILGLESERIPHATNFRNLLGNNGQTGLNPRLNIKMPKIFQNTFASADPRLTECLHSRTNNALKNLRESLNVLEDPLQTNRNTLLGKSQINPENIFGAVLKTRDDLNDKFEAFNSDLSRRLSSTSPRKSPEGSLLSWRPSRLHDSKNRADLNARLSKNIATAPSQVKTPTMKRRLLSKNVQNVESNKSKPTLKALKPKTLTDTVPRSNKVSMLKPNTKQKLGILPHQTDSDSKKQTKNIKFKPLKENKVTISFATTSVRPDTLKSELKPSIHKGSLRSRSSDGQKTNMNSKLQAYEPKVSPSEILMSRMTHPDTTVEKPKLTQKLFSLEDFKSLRTMKKNDGNLNAVTDATQSASNVIDRSAANFGEETLKGKLPYKCKMVCIKDILDATDTII